MDSLFTSQLSLLPNRSPNARLTETGVSAHLSQDSVKQ